MTKNRGLGKGLGALISEIEEAGDENKKTREVDITLIDTNPYQPRTNFSDEKLTELADSIKEHGVIQPLVVRERRGRYQLIAGERRLRASKIVGLSQVPIVIKELTDQSMMEVALVENLQREDLNIIEEANAYRRLMEEFQITQEEVAKKVGKSRSAVANVLRLHNLPQEIQNDLSKNILTMGHARAVLGLKNSENQLKIWAKIKDNNLSVRETEDLIKRINEMESVSRETKDKTVDPYQDRDPNVVSIEDELQLSFGTKVSIKPKGQHGRIEIEYYSNEEFERICERLMK